MDNAQLQLHGSVVCFVHSSFGFAQHARNWRRIGGIANVIAWLPNPSGFWTRYRLPGAHNTRDSTAPPVTSKSRRFQQLALVAPQTSQLPAHQADGPWLPAFGRQMLGELVRISCLETHRFSHASLVQGFTEKHKPPGLGPLEASDDFR
jgi:hypothetical protein